MRRTSCAGGLVLVLATTSAAAAAPGLARFGVMGDVGVPDGGTAAVVYRPIAPVRLSAGVGHNLIGPGVRAGLTLIPLSTWATPTLSVTVGRFAARDATPTARAVSGDPTLTSPALEHVGYDFADAHLGLELGRRRLTFYVHAGVTRIVGQVRDLDQTEPGGDADSVSVRFTEDPTVTVTTLSARVGLVFYIL